MCGISGFSLSTNDNTIRNSRALAGTLLLGIEHRGRDATGVCWFTQNNTNAVQKHPVTATAFVRNMSMWKRTRDAILHTRAWTQGAPSDNNNNHPIVVGPVVGVHNGGIWNDYELFKDMPDVDRIAEVDSEAAFAAIAYGIGRLNNSTASTILDCLSVIEGSAALAWYDDDDDHRTLHLARVSSSPLVVAQNSSGSFFFASTEDTIRNAVAKHGNNDIVYMESLAEGTYMEVREGRITTVDTFTPSVPAWKKKYSDYTGWNSTSSYTSKTTTTYAPTPADDDDMPVSGRAFTERYDLSSKFFDMNNAIDYAYADIDFDYRDRMRDIENNDAVYGKPHSNALGANLCPGAWVRTHVLGSEYWGQLIEMPDMFPGGNYTIRVMLIDNKMAMPDVVYVQRTVNEFRWNDSPSFAQPNADGSIESPVYY